MLSANLSQLPLPFVNKNGWFWTESALQLSETMPNGSFWPRISVVTPSYNQGQYIEETIRSVLLQGYPNLEYIIMDGRSTDDSVEIIKKYEPWLAFWVSEPDQGQSHAINKGIQKASGEILFWLNSDDLCLPHSFYKAAQAFHSSPMPSLVIGQAQIINAEGQIIGELNSQFTSWEDLLTSPRNVIRQVSTFFSRRLFSELGLIDEGLHIAMDTELLIRFTQFCRPLILDQYVTAYRKHSGAKTAKQLIRGYEESDRVRDKYFPNKKLADIYHKRSAERWLQMSRSHDMEKSKRLICMMRAVQNRPFLLFSRKFGASLKKMLIETIH